ncbi:hypothetical protein R3I93_007623 [Phoxinus phoxinus]|uniref:G-protein coupled receptors family 1 profile domain-containing protein n=1 Tax=Phoxinus phoxinus TaxID=58324 RepID=A0AAN9D958_9TELE
MHLNNTDCNTSHFRYPLFTSTYSIVLLFGFPLNSVSLWILLCRNGLKKSVPVIYMANLALSDLLFIISLPFRIIYFATGRWTLGNALCMIPGTLFAVNIYSSSLFITLISVDRMLAVVYPIRSRPLRTAPVAWALSMTVWLLIAGLAVPTAFNHPQNEDTDCNVTRCFEKYTPDEWKQGFIILCCTTFFGILVPFGIILGCTVAVVRQLRSYSLSKTEILPGEKSLDFYFNLQTVTMCMASTNSCLDPLIYYFSSKRIQGRSRCDSSSKSIGLGLVQSTSWTGQ